MMTKGWGLWKCFFGHQKVYFPSLKTCAVWVCFNLNLNHLAFYDALSLRSKNQILLVWNMSHVLSNFSKVIVVFFKVWNFGISSWPSVQCLIPLCCYQNPCPISLGFQCPAEALLNRRRSGSLIYLDHPKIHTTYVVECWEWGWWWWCCFCWSWTFFDFAETFHTYSSLFNVLIYRVLWRQVFKRSKFQFEVWNLGNSAEIRYGFLAYFSSSKFRDVWLTWRPLPYSRFYIYISPLLLCLAVILDDWTPSG